MNALALLSAAIWEGEWMREILNETPLGWSKFTDWSALLAEVPHDTYCTWAKERGSPKKRLPPMNEEKLADQLAAGGVSLSKDFVTMIVKHREEFVLVDVPWGVSVSYSMHDILKQVSYLLSRTRTRIPDRARVSISDAGLLSLTAVN